MRASICFSLLIALFLALGLCEEQVWAQIVEPVDCNMGETITEALQVSLGSPITIEITGKCNENVDIVRDDVTLIAAKKRSATVKSPDPNKSTILVRAARVTIDGLTVTGGHDGIAVSGIGGATIRNCTVQNAGRNGIYFYQDGRGSVDNCTVQNNGQHGISITAGSATVTNSKISSNTGLGIMVQLGGSAMIGIPRTGAGNTISKNQGSGVHIWAGGSAWFVGNTIEENGVNPNAVYGRDGILVYMAYATLWDGNTIINNKGNGISAVGAATVDIGHAASPGAPTRNTITGNAHGVIGNRGACLNINDADISNNMGTGLNLWHRSSANINASLVNNNKGGGINLGFRSSANINASTVNNNSGNGILLDLGGALVLPINPTVTVTGNTKFGLQCNDEESSYAGDPSGISGNGTDGQQNVSETCTGF